MDLENNSEDWMAEAPLLSVMVKKNPFSVPENYFNELEEQIKLRCALENVRSNDGDVFKVPANYFESLSVQIESRIAEHNIRSLAPTDGFKVPEEYFDTLEKRILTKTLSDPKDVRGSIISIRSNWIKYAAAACITLVVGSLVIFDSQNNSVESQLGRIPEQEMVSYLQMHSDMGDTPLIMETANQNINLTTIVNDMSDAELEEYINNTL